MRPILKICLLISILLATSESAHSPPGDVVGKITVGYQGWFAAPNSGQPGPLNGWWHWGNMYENISTTNHILSWPDVTDYTTTFPTNFANLGNNAPAALFSSYTDQTVDVHFRWMAEYNIDTAALQRFNPNTAEGPTRNGMAIKVRTAAENHGVKFYIMYDVSGWTSMQWEIKEDWIANMTTHTSSPSYARQNGKPVVGIYGFGYYNSPHNADVCLEVIRWFQGQGCYVMGGVPVAWLMERDDSQANFMTAYNGFDMISPWIIGNINPADNDGADFHSKYYNEPDLNHCNSQDPPIDYQPVVTAGNLTAGQRHHGEFMWRQFYNMVNIGVQGIYIAMFDEYNEATQIAKTPVNSDYIPKCSGFTTLDEDGNVCSSDYYLRLTGDGGRMLKGDIELTATRPTPLIPEGQSISPPIQQNC